MIDSHVHFWELKRGDYGWITPDRTLLLKNYSPEDFISTIEDTPVTGCIAIQASPTETDTDYLLSCAANNADIQGAIGWTDLTAPNVEEHLDRWQVDKAFKGIRPNEGVQSGPEWLDHRYTDALNALQKRKLVLEALVLPTHLNGIAAASRAHAELTIIINHAAKPDESNLDQWTNDIAVCAELPNVVCKLSGLTQQSSDFAHHARVCDVLLETFGPSRLMWGSDFPVLNETSCYVVWLHRTAELLAHLTPDEREQITSGTAERVYRL